MKKNYVNNYRGWAEPTCEITVAVGGAILIKKIPGQSSSTSTFRRAPLKWGRLRLQKLQPLNYGIMYFQSNRDRS